ncbi:MAG: DUF4011 domain-containing protein [Clostridia bacterium]|nr:DUF4011 domain-containing protein [Clostridia bacterium]
MAQKSKKTEEFISLTAEALGVVSYADYFTQTPLFTSLQIKNGGADAVTDLTLTVSNENGLLASSIKPIEEVPFESAVEVDLGNVLSPLYFVGLESVREEQIFVELKKDKQTLAVEKVTVTALPFDYWQGTSGNAELLASFVRPKLADCARLQSEIGAQLKKWGVTSEINGYEGCDKNVVRQTAAALYACIRRYAFEREETDISRPVEAGAGVKLLAERRATPLVMALLVSACLENLGLHPVLVLGEKEITCGVWLYDNCFMDTVSDDLQRLGKYVADGINNLSCFDVNDLFSDKNVAYSTSESHFIQKLNAGGTYDKYVDIRRCRIAHLLPLPLRARSLKGYEILSEEDMSPDAAPKMLTEAKKLSLDGKQTKDKQWERRLLDLSLKNTLLSFSPEKMVLHVLSADPDSTLSALEERGEMTLAGATAAVAELARRKIFFGAAAEARNMRELIALEVSGGTLRTFSEEVVLNETVSRLIKRSKEADEESGTKILYLALGFLKWYSREDGKEKYAPLVLKPIALKKGKGGVGYAVASTDEEFSVNSTLLEFLKQEFNIDIRGLDGALQGLKISEILAMIRMEIVNMKDWEVFDDVYVAAFSFARYQMWQDLRRNMDVFSKNELISSLLNNRCEIKDVKDVEFKEDECPPTQTLMPLPADSSQWEAVALSQTGKTFVLHGPPGTGKSQTITNIIANALNDGKRVLFVAEKQAALSVVKKRLDGLGLGEFCLELHSNKTNKADVLQKLLSTLALAGAQENVSLSEKANSIQQLKNDLEEPLAALHKKRRLGVSVYEALLICLKDKNAPDIMNIESTFYDSLTKEKIESYENMMVQAAAAAKECGGVYNSPFSNVNLTEYSRDKRDAIYCSSEVVIAEIKHLKNYVALFLELYRQRISTLTRKKLEMLAEAAKLLDGGTLNKYFQENEDEFYAFFNANKRLDVCFDTYFKNFKKLVDISKEYKELGAWLDGGGTDYERDKAAASVAKKLSKAALSSVKGEDMVKHLQNVCEIYEAMDRIRTNTQLSKNFTGAFGKVDFFDARENFLSDLYKLHALCAKLFMDYNADSFNSMCVRAANGYTKPVLKGLLRSVSSFSAAEDSFLSITNADRAQIPEEDVLEYYTSKAGALIDNIDMLANWCMYRATAEKLDGAGLTFMTDALESGSVTSENIVDSFEKNIYKNFLQTNIPLDPVLSRFSAALLEEETESLRLTIDEFAKLTKEEIRAKLISRLPTPSTEGSLSLEVVNFQRLAKSNLRGTGLRKLFEEIPELLRVVAPCMLMSPITVSQYLQADSAMFDIVIFDEASQMPTSEAIGSLARAKCAVVVGDPKQLPPTAFFNANYVDEENLENEDMESVLDDCLALGIPQRHLTWHYRSKHESLIAFSNIMYYGNKLCTFPSPDAPDSKVKFVRVEDGVYDRGFTKRNKAEGDALVAEVIRRLSDPALRKSSIGIVTFSNVQKEYIERKLTAAIAEKRLDGPAYDREEPIFVKNLENVQGDERDVILFSVCYGPDKQGRVSLNFGPLNQAGGWRRLNVAVSRAREEMVIFSSMTGAMIDLSKTGSKGVAGLKAFLEFAEKGRTTLAIPAGNLVKKKPGIGKYIAEELSSYGYDCRYDVGVSDFKIDVAVTDPRNKHKFILAVMCDGPNTFSIKDRNVLQIQTLKRNNWNVIRVYSVNYYNNPKREIKKIKDLLDKLTGADKRGGTGLNRNKKPYKAAALEQRFENATFITSGDNDAEILSRLKAIVSAEEPISYDFLVRRCLTSLGVVKYGAKVDARMQALVALCGFKYEKIFGVPYYRKTDKNIGFDKYRVETGDSLRKNETDYTPYEIVALIKSALEDKVALYMEEIMIIACNLFRIAKPTDKFAVYVNDCVTLGEEKGLFVRSVSDRISLA